jgi:hypothetical protein
MECLGECGSPDPAKMLGPDTPEPLRSSGLPLCRSCEGVGDLDWWAGHWSGAGGRMQMYHLDCGAS